jgi:ubiquinone/menaquinone biosynthesis C-methylase UbiE
MPPEEQRPGIQTYSKLAADYDQTRYVGDINTLKERFRREALLQLFPSSRPGRALDVGCGTGRGVAILREYAPVAIGVDGTFEMLAVARTKHDASGVAPSVCQGNAAALPFPDATFDLVTSLNFVHLFEPAVKRQFISEMGRVLKPGGVAIVEFDNAMLGVGLGVIRKYLGKDIGYDWPWVMRSCFAPQLFTITGASGANLPWIWRVPALRPLEQLARHAPGTYVAARIFIQAERHR